MVGREGGFGQSSDFGPLVLSIKCFIVIVLLIVREVWEDLVKEGVGFGQVFDDLTGFSVEFLCFFLLDDDVIIVVLFEGDWAVWDWRGAGRAIGDAVTFLIEHESAGKAFIFRGVELPVFAS